MEAPMQFMSVEAAVVSVGPANKSYEEVRYDDYLQSYITKGRAPEPVPQVPADEFTRKTLGLPALFKPTTVNSAGEIVPTSSSTALTLTPAGGATTTTATKTISLLPGLAASGSGSGLGSGLGSLGLGLGLGSSTVKPNITDPQRLPVAQVFAVTQPAGDRFSTDKFHSISVMPDYSFFSHEELRYYAYLTGNRAPPPGVEPQPFVQEVKPPPPASSGVGGKLETGEPLENICTRPGFDKHSPEEFRVAYMLYGREMNSAELAAVQGPAAAPVAAPVLALPAAAPVAALPAPPTLQPSLFGAPQVVSPAPAPVAPTLSSTPSTGMFTFGFKPR